MNSLNAPSKLLVIAQSARMLAQMAVDSGFRPVAVDCFGDSDTQYLALAAVKVASLALADARPAIEAMRKAHGLTHAVYGSGFEQHRETLAFLENEWVVLGNSVKVFRRFQNKSAFFSRLAELSIPYPETVFTPPNDDGNWLVKPMCGEGGYAIKHYDPDSGVNSSVCYWQRYLESDALSVLFIACRGKVNVLGFNRQWTTATDDDHPFVFGGIASHAEISAANQKLLSDWLMKLVEIYPIRGLGSLDFIVVDGRCYILEINPRIPASAQLYGESVFVWHVQACLGIFDDAGNEQSVPRAYQVIYAKRVIKIPEYVDWPQWVIDRPVGGAIIGKGQPICSIIAAGKKPGEVFELLQRRQQVIEKLLNTGS